MDESSDDNHKQKKASLAKHDTEIGGSEAHVGNASTSADQGKRTSHKNVHESHVKFTGIESDTQILPPTDETNFTKKKKSTNHQEISDAVRKRSEAMKTLLVSSDILPPVDDVVEEVVEDSEPCPDVGNSHFKFLKKRCGKLVDNKKWKPPWQCYNMLESEKSWRVIDEWAPTKQFIVYQDNLVVWRHEYPLAQHLRWDEGLLKDRGRPIFSSSWENII